MVIEGGNTTNQEQVFTKVNKINGLLLNQSCAGAMYAYWVFKNIIAVIF